jgi:hypothetical protein
MTTTTHNVYRYEQIDNGNSWWCYTFDSAQPRSTYSYCQLTGARQGATVERGPIQLCGTVETRRATLAQNDWGQTYLYVATGSGREMAFDANEIVAGYLDHFGLGRYIAMEAGNG